MNCSTEIVSSIFPALYRLSKFITIFLEDAAPQLLHRIFFQITIEEQLNPPVALIDCLTITPIVHEFIQVVEVQGQLSDKPISVLIRMLAKKNASGLLRVSRGKTIKAIFLEAGTPVFAISNAGNEQLEAILVQEGTASAQQIEEAKQRGDKANKLGASLVDMGVLTPDDLSNAVRKQVLSIIVSLFEWEQGEYVFDEKMRTSHEITLNHRVTDILLEGARHAAHIESLSQQIAPQHAVIIRGNLDKDLLDSGKLVPIESYVLSRIESPTVVSEVGAMSGLPDHEAHRAICALVASGFLKIMGDEKDEESVEAAATKESLEKIQEDINRKLHFYNNADFYEILEIGRQATTGEIKAAYYQLAKKYHPDRYRQAEHDQVRSRLETLFARITQAYEALSESGNRAAYDTKLRSSSSGRLNNSLPPTNPLPITPLSAPISKPIAPSGNLKAPNLPSGKSEPVSQPVSHTVVSEPQQNNADQKSAEYYYQQGRLRLERKEYHAAIHLLREAVKIDPAKAPYHFHLGNALLRNPRTRREADEHLTKSAELDPYNSQIRVKLGLLYKEMGLKKRAEHFFKAALSLDPDNKAAKKEILGSEAEKKGDMPSLWKSDMGTIAKRLFKR
jgi:curved DNA-binding protein CbpA